MFNVLIYPRLFKYYVDVACEQMHTDVGCEQWIMGLQWLLRESMTRHERVCLSRTRFIFRRARMKLATVVRTSILGNFPLVIKARLILCGAERSTAAAVGSCVGAGAD